MELYQLAKKKSLAQIPMMATITAVCSFYHDVLQLRYGQTGCGTLENRNQKFQLEIYCAQVQDILIMIHRIAFEIQNLGKLVDR